MTRVHRQGHHSKGHWGFSSRRDCGTTQVLSPPSRWGLPAPGGARQDLSLSPGWLRAAELCCLFTYPHQHPCGSKSKAGAATRLSPHPPSQSQGPGGSPIPSVTCLLSLLPLRSERTRPSGPCGAPLHPPPLRHTYRHFDAAVHGDTKSQSCPTQRVIELMACSLLK